MSFWKGSRYEGQNPSRRTARVKNLALRGRERLFGFRNRTREILRIAAGLQRRPALRASDRMKLRIPARRPLQGAVRNAVYPFHHVRTRFALHRNLGFSLFRHLLSPFESVIVLLLAVLLLYLIKSGFQ